MPLQPLQPLFRVAPSAALFAALVGLAACGDSGDASRSLELHIISAAGVAFAHPAKVAVSVYGYDQGVADGPADLVYTTTFDIQAVPATVQLVLPPDLAASIDQGFGEVPAERAGFGLYLSVDTDQNGSICPGDLVEIDGPDGGVRWGAGRGAPAASAEIQVGPVDSRQLCRPAIPE